MLTLLCATIFGSNNCSLVTALGLRSDSQVCNKGNVGLAPDVALVSLWYAMRYWPHPTRPHPDVRDAKACRAAALLSDWSESCRARALSLTAKLTSRLSESRSRCRLPGSRSRRGGASWPVASCVDSRRCGGSAPSWSTGRPGQVDCRRRGGSAAGAGARRSALQSLQSQQSIASSHQLRCLCPSVSVSCRCRDEICGCCAGVEVLALLLTVLAERRGGSVVFGARTQKLSKALGTCDAKQARMGTRSVWMSMTITRSANVSC